MRKGIHPEYMEAKVICSCGETFKTKATVAELHVELCSKCHPFYTGKQKFVDTGGRVQRFADKYGEAANAVLKREAEAAEARRKAAGEAVDAAREAKAKRDADKAEREARRAGAKPRAKAAPVEEAAVAEVVVETIEEVSDETVAAAPEAETVDEASEPEAAQEVPEEPAAEPEGIAEETPGE